MFKVRHVKNGAVYKVYGIDDFSSNTLWFLVFIGNKWSWIDSADYEPYEG